MNNDREETPIGVLKFFYSHCPLCMCAITVHVKTVAFVS